MIGLRTLWKRLRHIPDLTAGRLFMGSATLSAVVFDKDGNVKKDCGVIARKKVTGAFVTDIVANMVTEVAAFGDYKFHGTGIGTTAEANTQTTLVDTTGAPARATGSQVAGGTAAAPTYTSVATVAYTGTLAITEHGVFNVATNGTMLDRSVFSAINVVNGDSIQFTYVLTINAEA